MLFATLLLFALPQAAETESPPAATMNLFAGQQGQPERGPWRAWLDSPGGELPFGLHVRVIVRGKEVRWSAELLNGEERIAVPSVTWNAKDKQFILDMPHYDSKITATVSADGKTMDGRWRKRRGLDRWADMPFHARFYMPPPDLEIGVLERVVAPRFLPLPDSVHPDPNALAPPVAGTSPAPAEAKPLATYWRMKFESSADAAAGVFKEHADARVTGTILTTLGDYRYLAGRRDGNRIRLSCFDGAHAFLFDAQLQTDGNLQGLFYSGDSWQDPWVATQNDSFSPENAFADALLADGIDSSAPLSLAGLEYVGLDGKKRALEDSELHGTVTIISLFGSWCPNCNDEAAFFAELDRRYRSRGLRIIGLGFELTGEQERDLEQLKRFRDRWKLKYPLLLAGTANKKKAQAAFPLLAEVKSFPTAIILDHDGRVRKIHSGFSGPATGKWHVYMKASYEQLILELLKEGR
jgi:thiol-disulfide isomerase/thioredoxin